MGVVISPFDAIPFKSGVAISPLSLRPKGSDDRRIIMDCSWPIGSLLNYSIDTDSHMGQKGRQIFACPGSVLLLLFWIGNQIGQ